MYRLAGIAAALLLVTAGGCASPTVHKDALYSSGSNMSERLQQQKVGCTDYKDDARHPYAESQGHCRIRGVSVRLATFVDEWELNHWVDRMTDGSLRAGKGTHYLVKGPRGEDPRWIVDCSSYDAIARKVHRELGGELLPPLKAPR